MKKVASQVFHTKWGWMGLAATPRGITKIVLPRTSRRAAAVEIERQADAVGSSPARVQPARIEQASSGGRRSMRRQEAERAHVLLRRAHDQLITFLEGKRQSLDFPVDVSGGSDFQRKVWLAARKIPFGRARSYRWVADRVGGRRYTRAVGHALGANPVPMIVPCHRVVAHDGSLGGFTGGLSMKRRLLTLEGTLPTTGRKV